MKVWNTLKTTYKVSDFLRWYEDGDLNLNPDFQRRSVWKPGAKSYFVDTIIRNFPVPMIFLRDLKPNLRTFAPKRDVVDGQQRIRTLIAFIAPKLLGNDFEPRDDFDIWREHNEDLKGMKFRDLPAEVRSQILDYQFSVNVFPSDTGDKEVKQIFARMNSTGYKLNAQELRNAEFFGAFKTISETLATEQLDRWRDWKIFSSDDLARMSEVEFTSEFLIVMLNGISEKSEPVITKFYDDYDAEFKQSREAAKRFRSVFTAIEKRFAGDVRTIFSRRTLFYALFVAVYDRQFGIGSDLKPTPAKEISAKTAAAIVDAGRRIAGKKAPEAVMDAITRRTSHIKERRIVVKYLLKNA